MELSDLFFGRRKSRKTCICIPFYILVSDFRQNKDLRQIGGQQSQVTLPPSESLLKHFPKFRKTKAVEVRISWNAMIYWNKAILFPGDVLYLPPLWFHHVTALSTSMSVSVWTRFNETKTMYETVRSVLPLKSSWNEKKLALAGKVFLTLLLNKIKVKHQLLHTIHSLGQCARVCRKVGFRTISILDRHDTTLFENWQVVLRFRSRTGN